MIGLFYPYGIILQAIAIAHFARRRPDTYWLWIIIIGGGLGAAAYIVLEVIPDAGLLRSSFQIFPRRRHIKQLQAAIIDNPSIGNYEELGDLYLEDKKFAPARECYDRVIAARPDSPDPFYRRALAALALDDAQAAVADLERWSGAIRSTTISARPASSHTRSPRSASPTARSRSSPRRWKSRRCPKPNATMRSCSPTRAGRRRRGSGRTRSCARS